MKAKYLGLDLSSPVVVSSSPYTASIRNVEQCVRNGAGAVVLKSIFEEQIYRQAASTYPSATPTFRQGDMVPEVT